MLFEFTRSKELIPVAATFLPFGSSAIKQERRGGIAQKSLAIGSLIKAPPRAWISATQAICLLLLVLFPSLLSLCHAPARTQAPTAAHVAASSSHTRTRSLVRQTLLLECSIHTTRCRRHSCKRSSLITTVCVMRSSSPRTSPRSQSRVARTYSSAAAHHRRIAASPRDRCLFLPSLQARPRAREVERSRGLHCIERDYSLTLAQTLCRAARIYTHSLQKFTEETNDPFINPVNTPDNPNMWLETKSTGCVLL